MEALAALGVAAAVIQFIDFGSRITKDGIAAYKSATGLSEHNAELSDFAKELQGICVRLAPRSGPSQSSTAYEGDLRQLATECQLLAGELAEILSKLQVNARGPARSWVAVCKAVKVILKSKRLTDMRQSLRRQQDRAQLLILAVLRDSSSQTNLAIDRLSTDMRQLHIDSSENLRVVVDDLQASISEVKQANSIDMLNDVAIRLKSLEDRFDESTRVVAILKSLDHPDLYRREHGIADAYEGTYDWVFTDDRNAFRPAHTRDRTWPIQWHGLDDWLKTGSGIYWVTGKAGSGKSCLMKHVQESPRTAELLAEWSAGARLVIANHYFWRAGSGLQKSRQGLLRWLLLQICKHNSHLVKPCFPHRWSKKPKAYASSQVWTFKELTAAIDIALRQSSATKYCLFIDGLDEYEESEEEEGSRHDLTQLLVHIQCSNNIKICISSRPWIEFRHVYEQQQHLTLQDWTRRDIQLYIRGKLADDARFQRLVAKQCQAQNLTDSLLNRAEGVFLWVRLVIASLLRGLSKKDSLADLQKRLDLLPSDLDTYFMYMLDNIEPVYQERSACLLLYLAINTYYGNPPFLPEFIDNFIEQRTIALKLPQDELDTFYSGKRNQDLVDAWGPDLLELQSDDPEAGTDDKSMIDVSFAHRSISDFVKSSKVQAALSARLHCSMDWPYLEAMAHLYAFKRSFANIEHDMFWSDTMLKTTLTSAHRIGGAQSVDILGELIQELQRRQDHVVVVAICVHYQCDLEQLQVYVAIDFGITEYTEKMYSGPWQLGHLRTACAVFTALHPNDISRQSDSHLVERLLIHGLEPNAVLPGRRLSIWKSFLRDRVVDQTISPKTDLSTARVLVKYGAQKPLRFESRDDVSSQITVDADEVIRKLEELAEQMG